MTLAAEHFPSDADAMEDNPVNAMRPPAAGVGSDDPVDRMADDFGFGRRNGRAAERREGGDNEHQLSHFVSPMIKVELSA
jgi:hypothetical protein